MPIPAPRVTARAFLLDGDGVLYRGPTPLPGAAAFIAALNTTATPYLLLTNNASRTPQQLAAEVAAMGIALDADHIFTSAQATALWLQAHYPHTPRVLLIGEAGLEQALQQAGFLLTDDHRAADLVVVGLDRQATYARLAAAALAIGRGCPFIASNPDRSIPTERGIEPGAGALVALLEATTGVAPVMIGKPEPAFFHQALARLGMAAADAVMVGDRYETDILGGNRAGLRTVAVLTGISHAAEFAAADPPPTWMLADLQALLEAWAGDEV
ncbi:MAG: HAD-IIA family hydrolase [Caldilineales bacterium]